MLISTRKLPLSNYSRNFLEKKRVLFLRDPPSPANSAETDKPVVDGTGQLGPENSRGFCLLRAVQGFLSSPHLSSNNDNKPP